MTATVTTAIDMEAGSDEAEAVAVVHAYARRVGLAPGVETDLIRRTVLAAERLRGQGRPPRLLAVALMLESYWPDVGRLASEARWESLIREFNSLAMIQEDQ